MMPALTGWLPWASIEVASTACYRAVLVKTGISLLSRYFSLRKDDSLLWAKPAYTANGLFTFTGTNSKMEYDFTMRKENWVTSPQQKNSFVFQWPIRFWPRTFAAPQNKTPISRARIDSPSRCTSRLRFI